MLIALFKEESFKLFTFKLIAKMFEATLRKAEQQDLNNNIRFVDYYKVFLKMLCCCPDHDVGQTVITMLMDVRLRAIKQPTDQLCIHLFRELYNVFHKQDMRSLCSQIEKTPIQTHVKTELVKCPPSWLLKWYGMVSYWTDQCQYTKDLKLHFSEGLVSQILFLETWKSIMTK